jgi:diguanylate cyclase (GGDEF)-like protein
MLEYTREKGTSFDVAPDIFVKLNVKEASEVRELADGRVIAIARHMMQNGGWLATHEDITVRAQNEKRIAYLAQHDLLTGLANRALFAEKLGDASKRLQRHGTTFTVLMLDLDKFKNVNDTLGHPAGDQLLVEVGQRLRSSLRDTDVLARLGGDEFAIIQENEKNQSEGAIALALRVIGLIEQPFYINSHRVGVGTSIGIAFAPEHGVDVEILLKKADLALYAAKSGGRNDSAYSGPN